MFRKIHSNRDTGVTLWSELKKEFSKYYAILRRAGKAIVEANPKICFGFMLISLSASIVLCFSIMRRHEPPKPTKVISPVNLGFDQILKASSALKQTIELKKQIDSLSAKRVLTSQDSLHLDSDLDKLHQLNKKFTHEH